MTDPWELQPHVSFSCCIGMNATEEILFLCALTSPSTFPEHLAKSSIHAYYYLQSEGCLSMGALSISLSHTLKEATKIRHLNLHKNSECKKLA